MENIDPDVLLKKTAKPGMTGDLFLSLIIHALLIGLTSFGLYKAWAKWGIHSPSEIKMLEKAAAKEAAKAEAAAKAEEAAKAAAEEAAKKAEEEKASGKKAPAAAKDAKDAKAAPAPAEAKKAGGDEPQKTPLDQQVAKPPKNFDLNDIDL